MPARSDSPRSSPTDTGRRTPPTRSGSSYRSRTSRTDPTWGGTVGTAAVGRRRHRLSARRGGGCRPWRTPWTRSTSNPSGRPPAIPWDRRIGTPPTPPPASARSTCRPRVCPDRADRWEMGSSAPTASSGTSWGNSSDGSWAPGLAPAWETCWDWASATASAEGSYPYTDPCTCRRRSRIPWGSPRCYCTGSRTWMPPSRSSRNTSCFRTVRSWASG
mmetsp:Transcript_30517/g.73662  ORF Transcript_30517/g.73662 Transcript_30517/m.73662 type:complete len:217 (+) Transcript_30517:110-760(+)